MKTHFCLLITLFFAPYVNACEIKYVSSDAVVVKVIEKSNGFNFKNNEEICRKLDSENISFVISGHATVLSNRSVAWAKVSLQDRVTKLSSGSFGGQSTMLDEHASIDTAEAMLFDAINEAINSVDLDKAVQSLNSARRNVRVISPAKPAKK